MKDTDLYAQMLGLSAPWIVSKVDLALTDGRVDVFVEHTSRQTFACPDCARTLPVDDHSERRTWRLKESLRKLWDASSARVAQRFHRWWDRAARASGLRAMVQAAQSIADHLDGILTYFTHRITNATAEGINSGVQVVKSRARGFRNVDHFQTAVLFYCGGDTPAAAQLN